MKPKDFQIEWLTRLLTSGAGAAKSPTLLDMHPSTCSSRNNRKWNGWPPTGGRRITFLLFSAYERHTCIHTQHWVYKIMKSLGFVLLLFLCTFLYLSSSELSSFSDSSSACSNPCDEALDQRISALERVFHIHSNASADASYLELAWMKLSSFAYNLTKPTDSECTFSWKTMQCAPKCQWYFLFFLHFFL